MSFFWCILKSKTPGLRRTPKATQALLSTGPSTVIASVRAVREKCFRATDVEPSIHACVLVQNFSEEWNANQFAGKFLGCKTQSKWSWKDPVFLKCTQPPITSHFLFSLVLGRRWFFGLFLLLSTGPKVWQVQSSSSTASTPIWSEQIPVLLGRTPSKNIPKIPKMTFDLKLSLKSLNQISQKLRLNWISLDFYMDPVYIYIYIYMYIFLSPNRIPRKYFSIWISFHVLSPGPRPSQAPSIPGLECSTAEEAMALAQVELARLQGANPGDRWIRGKKGEFIGILLGGLVDVNGFLWILVDF